MNTLFCCRIPTSDWRIEWHEEVTSPSITLHMQTECRVVKRIRLRNLSGIHIILDQHPSQVASKFQKCRHFFTSRFVNEIFNSIIRIYLGDGKQKRKDTDCPMLCHPALLNARNRMPEEVVVVNTMMICEVHVIQLRVRKFFCDQLTIFLPLPFCHTTSIRKKSAADCHHLHNILWLLNSPQMIRNAIQITFDSIRLANFFVAKVRIDDVSPNICWPVPTLFNKSSGKLVARS